MRLRLLSALSAAICPLSAAQAAPVPAAKAGGPPMVVATAPIGKLIASAKAIAKAAAGEQFAGMVDQGIQGKFGQAGLDGLDLTKPITGYVNFPEKVPADAAGWADTSGVVVVPVTSAEKFKAMLARGFGDQAPQFKPVAGDDGLYEVTGPDGNSNFPIHARFADGSLYVGINVPKEGMAAGKLARPADLADPKATALLTVRSFADRMPEEWRKNPFGGMDEQIAKLKEQIGGAMPWAARAADAYGKMIKGMAARYADAEESGYRVRFAEDAGDFLIELYTKPKAGTKMAAELATRQPATNQFGSIVTKDTAAGLTLSVPFGSDFRDLVGPLLAEGEKHLDGVPEDARPLVKELLAGVGRTVQGDSLDVAVAVNGTSGGPYVVAAGLTFAGADKLESPVKDLVRVAKDEPFRKAFKFDVAKSGGVNLHEFTVPTDAAEPPAFAKFAEACGGRTATLAFGPKGVYVGFGSTGRAAVENLLSAKPAAADPFAVLIHPKRLGALVAAVDANAANMVRAALGEADKRVPAVYVRSSAADGELRWTFGVSVPVAVKPFAMLAIGRAQ